MSDEIQRRDDARVGFASSPAQAATLEKIVKAGDLAGLDWPERWRYYLAICEATGLDPTTRPLDFIEDSKTKKVVLYLNKEGAAQLRKRYRVNIDRVEQKIENGLCVVTAYASLPSGRRDSDTGIVAVENAQGPFRGDWLGNAIKKATTQAKRRVTISICGLGFLDETEVDQVPSFSPLEPPEQLIGTAGPAIATNGGRLVDTESGEILEESPAEARLWTNSSGEPVESYLDRTEVEPQAENDFQPTSPDTRPASSNQAATVAKLSRLLGHPQELAEDATSAEASEIITELSQEYNELKGARRF